jgi:dCMP deaminase
VSEQSKDRSRKVGAVIVGTDMVVKTVGYNSLPRGAKDLEERALRPAKYLWTEHAERNAIYDAARRGIALDGGTIYIPWFPCMDCARAIVQAGIRRLVGFRPDHSDPTWGEHFIAAMDLFREAGVEIDFVESDI